MTENTTQEAGCLSHLSAELGTAKKNCNWFTGHKWKKWHEIGRGNMVADKTITVGFWIKQERVCLDCGLKQLRVDSV